MKPSQALRAPLAEASVTPALPASALSGRRAAILASAQALFSRYGYRGVALRQIAADAGVSLTLLDHHFGAKPQLFLAVVEAWRGVVESSLDELRAVAGGQPCTAGPAELVDRLLVCVRRLRDQPAGAQLLWMHLRSRHDDDPLVTAALAQLFAPVEAAWGAALLAAYPALDGPRLTALYPCVRGALLEGYVRQTAAGAAPVDEPAFDEQVRRFLIGGLAAVVGVAVPG